MKKTKKWSALVCAIALIVVVPGCSDDDNPMGTTIDPATASAAAQAAVTSVVLPTMTVFGILAQLIPAPAPGGGGDGAACSGGGTATLGEDGLTFNMCIEDGVLIDGTIMGEPGSEDGISWDLTVDGNPIVGTGIVDDLATCGPQLTFVDFMVTDGGVATSVAGALEFCGGDYPQGAMTLTISGPAFDLIIQLLFDGTAIFSGTVTDLSSGEIAATCTGDLSVPSVNCI